MGVCVEEKWMKNYFLFDILFMALSIICKLVNLNEIVGIWTHRKCEEKHTQNTRIYRGFWMNIKIATIWLKSIHS